MSTIWTQADIDRFNAKKGKAVESQAGSIAPGKFLFALGRMKARKMNKTERLYADILDLKKKSGEVIEYWFEEINLRLSDNCFYKADFFVLMASGQLEVHETKGGYVTDDALVQIKAAAEKFPFRFYMKKLVKGVWESREF